MKRRYRIACFVCCLALSFPLCAQERKKDEEPKPRVDWGQDIDLSNPEVSDPIGPFSKDEPNTASKAVRFTLGHEGSFRTRGEQGVVNNRSWFRIEYSKFFLNSFFVQIDSKLNGFWHNDHRAKAEGKRILFETNTQEAFLQYSGVGAQTSVKAGVQRLIWGESEAGAITDEVSPRNYSELFFIPLEESRIGQFMLNLDHFSANGDWSLFFVPEPKMNKYPLIGTAYYVDPFNGLADIRDEPYGKKRYEYGMRWKKTLGKSDISFMAASLMDNDYIFRMDGVTNAGRLLISRIRQRFALTGTTFNYTEGKFLVKGEMALKSTKGFNDAAFHIIEKDVIDSSLGVTYSLGQSDTTGLEFVNSHVNDWSDRIVSVRQNSNSFVLNTNLFFLSDMLSVNWLLIYSQPYTSYQSSIRTSYKWSDNTIFSLDAHFIAAPDENSSLRPYRDQSQIVLRAQYQF